MAYYDQLTGQIVREEGDPDPFAESNAQLAQWGMGAAPAMPPREGMMAGGGAPPPPVPMARVAGGTPGGGTPEDNAVAFFLNKPPQTVYEPDAPPAPPPAPTGAPVEAAGLTTGLGLGGMKMHPGLESTTPHTGPKGDFTQPSGGVLQQPRLHQPTEIPPTWTEYVGGRPHQFEMTGRTTQSQEGIEVPEDVWRLTDESYIGAHAAAEYGADAAYKTAKVARAWEIGKAEAEEDAAVLKGIQQREYESELESRRNYYENLEVDSRRVWNNMGAFQKVIAIIGMALGGGLQAVTGQNPYMDIFNKIVDDDINDQKANREAIRQGIGILGEQHEQTMGSLEEERIKRLHALSQQVHKMANEMGVDSDEVNAKANEMKSSIDKELADRILAYSELEAGRTAISRSEGWRGGAAGRLVTRSTDPVGVGRAHYENALKDPNTDPQKALEIAEKRLLDLGFTRAQTAGIMGQVQQGVAGKPSMALAHSWLSEEKMKEGGYEFVPTGPAFSDGSGEPGVKVTATNAVALTNAQIAKTRAGNAITGMRAILATGHGTREVPLSADWATVRSEMRMIRENLKEVYPKITEDGLNEMLGRPQDIMNFNGVEAMRASLERLSGELDAKIQNQYGRPTIRTFIVDPVTGERKSAYYEQGTSQTRPFVDASMRASETGTGGHTGRKGPARPTKGRGGWKVGEREPESTETESTETESTETGKKPGLGDKGYHSPHGGK